MLEKEREKGTRTIKKWSHFGAILGAKNLQTCETVIDFMLFRDFWKKMKQTVIFQKDFQTIFDFRGSQNPHVSRDCYRRVPADKPTQGNNLKKR